jgi:hypothetical protein
VLPPQDFRHFSCVGSLSRSDGPAINAKEAGSRSLDAIRRYRGKMADFLAFHRLRRESSARLYDVKSSRARSKTQPAERGNRVRCPASEAPKPRRYGYAVSRLRATTLPVGGVPMSKSALRRSALLGSPYDPEALAAARAAEALRIKLNVSWDDVLRGSSWVHFGNR